MKKNNLYILYILTLFLSCKPDLKNESYDKKATEEFVKELLQQENLLNVNCIMEESLWNSKLDDDKLELLVKKELKIKDISYLEFQIDLFNKFKATTELFPEKNIIKKDEYIQFNESFKESQYAYLDWLNSKNCKKGFLSVSKPLFNENYNIAMVHMENICGPMCGGGAIVIYNLKNKKWTQKAVIDNWVK